MQIIVSQTPNPNLRGNTKLLRRHTSTMIDKLFICHQINTKQTIDLCNHNFLMYLRTLSLTVLDYGVR
jgi:hypothetical protein